MAMSSSDSILSLAKELKEMPMFPVFHIVDSLLTSVYVRHQFGSKAYGASRKHPLALWFVTILSIKAGTLITALLLGEPVLDPFKHTKILLTNTLCWYALFYSPYDIVYRICTCGPLAIGLGTLNEIYRVHRIFHGIQHTSELYPDSWTIMMFVGTIKGNSSALVEFTQMLIRGDWKTNLNSFQISFLTKASFCGSLALVATQHSHILLLVYFCVCMFLVYNQIVSAVIGPQDPFLAIEKVIDKVFFGGLWDKWIKQDTGNNEKPHEQ